MNVVWTVAQVGLLAQAWRDGQRADEIAQMVGMSASAVRGKRLRLGLPPRSSQAALAAHSVAYRDRFAASAPLAPPLDPLPGSTPRPWIMRERGECAWPVRGFGEQTASCCLPICEKRAVYCPGHMALMRREPWPPADPGNVVLFRPKR